MNQIDSSEGFALFRCVMSIWVVAWLVLLLAFFWNLEAFSVWTKVPVALILGMICPRPRGIRAALSLNSYKKFKMGGL